MKTQFTVIIMALLVTTTLFLIYQNPDETPESMTLEKHSNEIAEINEESKKYQSIGDEQKFIKLKTSMQEKLKEISLQYMGLEISHVELLDRQYPFWYAHNRAEELEWVPPSICDFEKDIPLHMQKISHTDNFQMFSKNTLQLILN